MHKNIFSYKHASCKFSLTIILYDAITPNACIYERRVWLTTSKWRCIDMYKHRTPRCTANQRKIIWPYS